MLLQRCQPAPGTSTYSVPSGCFRELEKIILNFIWRSPFGKISKELLKKKNEGGGGTALANTELYYKATKQTAVLPQTAQADE